MNAEKSIDLTIEAVKEAGHGYDLIATLECCLQNGYNDFDRGDIFYATDYDQGFNYMYAKMEELEIAHLAVIV